jgi:hypothetical protein
MIDKQQRTTTGRLLLKDNLKRAAAEGLSLRTLEGWHNPRLLRSQSLGEKQPTAVRAGFEHSPLREGYPGLSPHKPFEYSRLPFLQDPVHLQIQQKWPPTSRTLPTTSSGRPSVCASPLAPKFESKRGGLLGEKKEFRQLLEETRQRQLAISEYS